jgi:hypothetical protein
MSALAIVQREVDELIDDVLDHVPRGKRRLGVRIEAFDGLHACAQ